MLLTSGGFFFYFLFPLTFIKGTPNNKATSPSKDDVFVLKRCQGTTPAQICPRSRTVGKPLLIRSSWGDPESPTSVTPAMTSWGATPSPASGTSAGAAIPHFVRKVRVVLLFSSRSLDGKSLPWSIFCMDAGELFSVESGLSSTPPTHRCCSLMSFCSPRARISDSGGFKSLADNGNK